MTSVCCDWSVIEDGSLKCQRCDRHLPRWREGKPVPFAACKASRGLGDTVAKVTRKLGIRRCGGCKERQEKLNKLFPYR